MLKHLEGFASTLAASPARSNGARPQIVGRMASRAESVKSSPAPGSGSETASGAKVSGPRGVLLSRAGIGGFLPGQAHCRCSGQPIADVPGRKPVFRNLHANARMLQDSKEFCTREKHTDLVRK
jgi:hypothetical protein